MEIGLKRAYEAWCRSDGYRVLVDRLWPRGMSNEEARVSEWLRALAPSTELRKWFHERPAQWLLFRKRYLQELAQPKAATALERLHELAHEQRRVTLVYSSRNQARNNAVVLKELLEGSRKPPHSSGPIRAAARARARRGAK